MLPLVQKSNKSLITASSAGSMERPYLTFTEMTVSTNQHRFLTGIHSAMSRSLLDLLLRFQLSVRFRGSFAKALRVARSAWHSPETWASFAATICSTSMFL